MATMSIWVRELLVVGGLPGLGPVNLLGGFGPFDWFDWLVRVCLLGGIRRLASVLSARARPSVLSSRADGAILGAPQDGRVRAALAAGILAITAGLIARRVLP